MTCLDKAIFGGYNYVIDMRKFGILLLITIFFTNTSIVSAWAKSCLGNDIKQKPTIETVVDHTQMNMPCDDMDSNKNSNDVQHCEGDCSCIHVSSQQFPVLNIGSLINFQTANRSNRVFTPEDIISIQSSPPVRPPRIIL